MIALLYGDASLRKRAFDTQPSLSIVRERALDTQPSPSVVREHAGR